MNINNLSLLFLKLYLKNNLNFANKLKLKSKFKLKSFYKNEENIFISNLDELNKNILYKFYNNLYNLYFVYKILIYTNIKKNNFIFKNKIVYSSSDASNKLNNYLYNIEKNKINIKDNNSFMLSLFSFYYIYFIFMVNLKFINGINIRSTKLPNKISKLTLLRSPHIDKKSREQFEILTHISSVNLLNLFGSNIKQIISKTNNNSYIEISI